MACPSYMARAGACGHPIVCNRSSCTARTADVNMSDHGNDDRHNGAVVNPQRAPNFRLGAIRDRLYPVLA